MSVLVEKRKTGEHLAAKVVSEINHLFTVENFQQQFHYQITHTQTYIRTILSTSSPYGFGRFLADAETNRIIIIDLKSAYGGRKSRPGASGLGEVKKMGVDGC